MKKIKDKDSLINWSECEREFIRKVEADYEKVSSIRKKALQRLKRARETKVLPENISFIVEDYYEVIKELLVAYLLKNGLRSKNHQCLIRYFYKNNPSLEKEALLISQMSYFRNRLDYYGEDIPVEFYETNKKDFENVVSILLKLLN